MPERGGADVLSDSCGAESRECMHAQGTGIDATRRDLACTDTGHVSAPAPSSTDEVDRTRHATCAGNESSGRREVQEERRERHGRPAPARPGPRFPLCTRGAAAFRVRVVVVVDSALRARNWMRRRRGGECAHTCTLVVVCMQSRRSADGPGHAPEIRANGRKGSRGVLAERLRGGESKLVKRSQCEDEDGRPQGREFAAARRVRLV
ncbi:hypothetical protein C8R43DRAFT_1028110 [Mycena crocata]|nr:hypothetical protein C8R43DRAFT_1028079 [Mycena crocata]KAJ7127226.1 hypothetical protein C8R43DRAFT_1028090 [Mycena crocata]KAJ7127230.1 hypothetical protein C8R43DRAFT_1028099 [Mycena crocata]KAJ7127234.1 hypothetical protein C8R43DRAFT_1028110 [Mycena crocata]